MSTQPCMEESLLQTLRAQTQEARDKQDTPAQPLPEHSYPYFCIFCLQETLWHGMGNISECQQCHVQGTNYGKVCPNHPNKPPGYLFSLENCVPHIEDQPLMAVMDNKLFQCFACCFDAMAADGDLPFKYIYRKEDKSEKQFCWSCQAQTQWQAYSQRRQTIQDKHVVLEQNEELDDQKQQQRVIQRCSDDCCLAFKTVVSGTPCSHCENETNEIYFSSSDDAKCRDCLEQNKINSLMMAELKEKHEEEQNSRFGSIQANCYKYYCPFCYDITQWNKMNKDYSKCAGCGSEGSAKPGKCVTCLDRVHTYRGDKDGKCAKCVKGLGPKDVVGVKVMACLFCNNRLNTFYEYGIGLMGCTGCDNYRTCLGPHGEISEQYCKACKSAQPDLWRQNDKEQCRKCWNEVFQYQKIQDLAQRQRFELDEINQEVAQPKTKISKQGNYFKYECPFCGIDDQTWCDLGTGSSQCQGCRTIGTNDGDEPCPHCKKKGYIFTINKLSKCFSCWNVEGS